VNLFFVLSGFVLFYPYVTARRTMESNQDWRSYYRHRALRLLPLYFVSVIYGFLVIAPPQSTAQWVRDGSLMLTATFGFAKDLWYPQYNWVLWSLGIELWFSVLFPFLVALTRKLTAPRTLVVAAVLAVAARYLGLHEIFQLRGSVYLGPLRDSLLGRLDDFVLGMFIAWLWLKSPRALPSLDESVGGGSRTDPDLRRGPPVGRRRAGGASRARDPAHQSGPLERDLPAHDASLERR